MAANDSKQLTTIPVLGPGDTSHNFSLPVTIQGGAGSGGTSSSYGAAFPSAGTAVGAKDSTGALMSPLNLDASGYLKVNVAAGGAGGGAVTVANGDNVVEGATTDVAVTADANGTLSAKLRGVIVVLLRAFQLGTPLRTDPTGTTTQPVSASSLPLPTGAATLAKQPALGTAGSASTDVISIQGIASMTAVKTDGSGVTQPISGTVAATQSGTWTIQPGNTANTTAWKVDGSAVTQPVSIATNTPSGPTTSGASLTANPLTIGGLAKTALPTAVTDGQVVNRMLDKYGRAVIIPQAPRDLVGTQTTTISASTSETTIVTAAASIFNDICTIFVANTSATAARVDFRDDTAGTVIFSIYAPAGATTGFCPGVPVPQTAVNKNWTAQSSASVTDLRIFVEFVKNR